ncbi:hypothetical protein M3J09_007653 [Ascochyta lentis]
MPRCFQFAAQPCTRPFTDISLSLGTLSILLPTNNAPCCPSNCIQQVANTCVRVRNGTFDPDTEFCQTHSCHTTSAMYRLG